MEWLLAIGLSVFACLEGAHAFSLTAPPRAASSSFLTGGGIPNQPEAPTSTAAALSLVARARTSTRKTFTLSASPCPPLLFPGADGRLLGEKRNLSSGIPTFGSSPKGRFISSLSSTGGGGGGGRDDGSSPRGQRRGLLRRVVQRVVKTGKTVGQQAGDRIRGERDDSVTASNDGVVAPSTPTPRTREGKRVTLRTADSAWTRAGTRAGAAAAPTTGSAKKVSRGAGKAEGSGGGQTWSPIDMAVRPLQAFAAVMLKQTMALEGDLSLRISKSEAELAEERGAMRATLKQAEAQLTQLKGLSAAKQKAEENEKRIKAEAEQAKAVYSASADKLKGEAELVRKRLEKERGSVAASQAEAAKARALQEQERASARERLAKVEEELERERKNAKESQASLSSKLSAKTREQSQALTQATGTANKAELERSRADRARGEAETRALAAEKAAAAAEALVAEAKGKAEREVALARKQAAAAAVEAAEAKNASGIEVLKAELAAAMSELKEQTDRAQALENAKKRTEVEAEKRNRSLEELTEKSRARYEKTTADLKTEIKELSLLKSAAAGFEDVKAKLGLAQNKSLDLEREAASLKNKVETLDQKLADSAEKSSEERLLLAKKEAALKEADAQLKNARARADGFERDALRVPELQGQIEAASEAVGRERQRADELQMEQDQAAAQTNQVKDQLFDLERSVEMSEWNERKLVRENAGLQSLLSRNRKRFQRELSKLTEASTDLADKTVALEELEAVVERERESAKQLGKQVNDLKEKTAAMAVELSATRDKLTKETEKRLRAEAALRQATDRSYAEQLKDADQALQKAQQEGQAATEELQATLRKERTAWTQERSSLATRLEEALRSTEASTTRVAELEEATDQLRKESTVAQAEVEGLRDQLVRAKRVAGEIVDDQKRLQRELASAAGAVEDRTRLQQSVASLKAALEKATGGDKIDPSSSSPHQSDDSGGSGGSGDATTPTAPRSGSDSIKRYDVLSDADGRENAEAVTEINDFLERSQDVVGSGINDGDTAEPLTGSSGDVANGASQREGPPRREDREGPKRPDRWVGAPRWSRNRET